MLNLFTLKGRISSHSSILNLKKFEVTSYFFKSQFNKFNKFNFAEAVTKKESIKPDANKPDEYTDIHNYKPIEEMTREDLADRLRDNRKELYYYYGSSKRSEQSKIFNKTEFAAKKLRQMWFRAGDLSSHKHIIPIKRLRTRDEGLFKLMNQGELAGVIEGREEFADVDFVVDKQYIKRLDGLPLANVKPFYLKFGNDEIKCTLIKKDVLPVHNRPTKIRFQRFIEGRPNLLKLKIKLIGRHLQPLLHNMNVEIAQYYNDVEVWCTTEEYPPIFEIDTRWITPDSPFKFLDLSLMLPEGMWLHRKYDRVMYNSIASMGENFNMIISSTLYPADDPENVGGVGGEDTELTGELKEMNDFIEKTQGAKTNKKKALSMPLGAASSKKLMQIKNDGADAKAIRKLMKTAGDKKMKKGAPVVAGKKPEKAAAEKPAETK